ncbi:class I SAM-dependent methyltransferase [Reyranella sp. CPCC 100927]|nr:class I SAM-dependent methyltransferase [Reyranella sp. CPCC 100927]
MGLPVQPDSGSDRKQHSSRVSRSGTDVVLDSYVDAVPSAQNAIDIVPGWNHAMPPHVGATAGDTPLYEDIRIPWCLEQFGSVSGRKILELGPLEGIHTYLLDQQGPAFIHAIEANRLAFLRCLITKELLEIKHAKFMLGNFLPWLERTDVKYDLIIASGVLYHMSDPVHLLELIGRRSDAVYLWTHYFSEQAMPPGDERREALSGDVETIAFRGLTVPLYRRGYHNAWKAKAFCGGMHDRHYWMEREDIMRVLGLLGFDDIRIAHDQPDHSNGPAFSVFARRSAAGA